MFAARSRLSSTLKVSKNLFQLKDASKNLNCTQNRFLTSVPTSIAEANSPSNVVPPEPSKGIPVLVKAYYTARAIDITKIPQGTKIYGAARRQYDQRSVIIPVDESKMQHIGLFKYGSVVFFNIPEEEHEKYLKEFKDTISFTDIQSDIHNYTETYKVLIHQNLDKPSVIKAEHLNVRSLSVNNLIIIGTVMAQSVALDYFAQRTETMLETFLNSNSKIHDGTISSLKAKELYKLTAANNMILASLLSKMGILEVTDAAWDSADYTYTWEELRKDFEIEYRYRDIRTKLELIKDDSRFFIEILQNRKATITEISIIVLIAVEVVMGLLQFKSHF